MNLADITPPWLDFRVMSEVPDRMYEGMMVQYKVHPFAGMPVWWVTDITHVKEPYFLWTSSEKVLMLSGTMSTTSKKLIAECS